MSYGTSIKLNDANDFAFDASRNRLSLVSGTDNLVQATEILLKTGEGEIKTFPTFGIDMPTLLDINMSDDNIKNAVYNAVIRDPRVASINKISINRDNRILYIDLQLTAYDGAKLDFRVSGSW